MKAKTKLAPALLCSSLALAACAGGGGGNPAASIPSVMTNPAPMPSTNPAPTPPETTGPPLPLPMGGFGPTPASVQLAVAGGPSFTGASGSFPVANTSFPVLAASMVATGKIDLGGLDAVGLTGASWAPEPSATSVTATVVSVAADGTMQIQLSVPFLNLSEILPLAIHAQPGLDYVELASWQVSDAQGSPIRFTTGVFGYETPAVAMPVSGAATYKSAAVPLGGAVGGTIFSANGDAIAGVYGGNATLSVNFATGQISGGLTNLVAHEEFEGDGYNIPWYDVSIAASIAAGTNKFSGTTTRGAVSVPLGGYCQCALPVSASLKGSATGSINGAFYGPAAQNLGATWTIGDSNMIAVGSFIAATH